MFYVQMNLKMFNVETQRRSARMCHCINKIQMRITDCDWSWWRWSRFRGEEVNGHEDGDALIHDVSSTYRRQWHTVACASDVLVCWRVRVIYIYIQRVQILSVWFTVVFYCGCAPFYLSFNLNFRSPSRRMFSSHCMALPWQSSTCILVYFAPCKSLHKHKNQPNSRREERTKQKIHKVENEITLLLWKKKLRTRREWRKWFHTFTYIHKLIELWEKGHDWEWEREWEFDWEWVYEQQ